MSAAATLRTGGVDTLRERALQEVERGFIPSCQFALAVGGEVVVHETLGGTGRMRYSIFSATKPVVASVVMAADGRGLLDPLLPSRRGGPASPPKGKGR
jgi:CubicO group peptidase (beta-lactamase class C family)